MANNDESFIVYHDGIELQLQWDTRPPDEHLAVLRICALTEDLILLLTSTKCLYTARLDAKHHKLNIHLSICDVNDVGFCHETQQLYIVTIAGNVLMHHGVNFATLNENALQKVSFDPLELSQEGIRIRRVCCSSQGALFVTQTDEIYAMGSCGDIFSAEMQPKHLSLLNKDICAVLDIVAGDEYFVFLVKRRYTQKDHLANSTLLQNHLVGQTATPIFPAFYPQNSNGLGTMPELDERIEGSLKSSSKIFAKGHLPSADKENFIANMEHIIQMGFELIKTHVFTLCAISPRGVVRYVGEKLKRITLNEINELETIGVCSIVAGREQIVAQSLDGCLYNWNTTKQLSKESDVTSIRIPTKLGMIEWESSQQQHFLEAACQEYQTVLLDAHENRNKLDKQLSQLRRNSSTYSVTKTYPLLLASGSFTVKNLRRFQYEYNDCFTSLQVNLRAMLRYRQTTIDKIRRIVAPTNSKQLLHLVTCYTNTLYLLATIVHAVLSYYRNDISQPMDLVFLRFYQECIELFKIYSKAFCDFYAIDGFTELSNDFLKHFPDSELNFIQMFQQPFEVPENVLKFLEQLIKSHPDAREELCQWQSFLTQNKINIELADNTQQFWQHNARNTKIQCLKDVNRRVVLTSAGVPLKITSNAINMTNTIFILFLDSLCQIGSQVFVYPLVTIWLRDENDTSLRIITPERSITVTTRNPDDKLLWYSQLQSSISLALGHTQCEELSDIRNAVHVFSKNHPKYPGVRVSGYWNKGILHGDCYLEYPNGKLYYGNVSCGEIEGYGRMLIPTVGLYEGTFHAGKFQGYGILKTKTNEMYEGNFRDGVYHGHGFLRGNSYTHIGEYKDNVRCGYGILDDMLTGEKYMGTFVDGKRSGIGICITMGGDYYEGVFTNDELMGNGVAILENDYYYEGEMTLHGPNGKGSYYMPNKSTGTKDSNVDGDNNSNNPEVIGNILIGQLSGTWNDMRVVSGALSMNKKFPKYPNSIEKYTVDNERKWQSLFESFEEQIFVECRMKTSTLRASPDYAKNGVPALSETKHLWKCIAKFMTRQRNQETTQAQQHPAALFTKSLFKENIKLDFFNHFPFDKECSVSGSNRSLAMAAPDFNFLEPNNCKDTQRSHSLEVLCNNNIESSESRLLQTLSIPNNSLIAQSNESTPSLRSTIDSVENLSESFDFNNQFGFEWMPNFGMVSLTQHDVSAIKEYLNKAFKDPFHPLYHLSQQFTNAFYTSYGCWTVKPTTILARQAIYEWESILKRVYKFIRKMFPALPDDYAIVENPHEVISHKTILYPIVLSEGVYSTLFVLYANKYSHKDELYRQNFLYAETLNDEQLADCLALESSFLPVVYNASFKEAIETLKLLQNKYNPKAMLTVIENCMQQMTDAYKMIENSVILTADGMMPLTLFLILRARVPRFGAELALLEDLASGIYFQFEMNGMAGYCYTTLKASYEHIAAKPLKKM